MVFAALFAALTAAVSPIKIPLGFTPVPITLQTLMVLLSGALLGANLGALSQFLYVLVGALGLPVFAGGSSGFGALFGPTGGYLISYPIAAYVVGLIKEKEGVSKVLKYLSAIIISFLVLIAYADLILNIGVMKLWSKESNSYVAMTSLMTPTQRYALFLISFVVISLLFFLIVYLKKRQKLSANVLLGMFAGTAVIYLLGSIQGKLVTKLPWSAIFVGWVLPFIVGDTVKLLIACYIAKNVSMNKYLR